MYLFVIHGHGTTVATTLSAIKSKPLWKTIFKTHGTIMNRYTAYIHSFYTLSLTLNNCIKHPNQEYIETFKWMAINEEMQILAWLFSA